MTQPILLINALHKVVNANSAIDDFFDVASAELVSKDFPACLGFSFAPQFKVSTVTEITKPLEADFVSGTKKGVLSYTVQPLAYGQEALWMVVITSIRSTVAQAPSSTEELLAEMMDQKADLIISRDELERKVSQMSFLLEFYTQTRFVLDPSLIAQIFLKIVCERLGFMTGIYFSKSPSEPHIELKSIFSLDEGKILENVAPLTFGLSDDNIPPLTLLNQAELIGHELYKKMGHPDAHNAVVLSLLRDGRLIGQFHFLNFMHSSEVDWSTIEWLNYMLAPLELTFENAELYQSSVTDDMTKLKNYRYFRSRLKSELKRAEREEKTVCLMMFDIDHFKKVNDTYGHPTGDRVIYAMAKCLENNVRTLDVVARYGGEEFAIIMPGLTTKNALIIAEKIRTKIEEITVTDPKGTLKISASIGISVFPDKATDDDSLIDGADQALYLAKTGGRNQSKLFGDEKI